MFSIIFTHFPCCQIFDQNVVGMSYGVTYIIFLEGTLNKGFGHSSKVKKATVLKQVFVHVAAPTTAPVVAVSANTEEEEVIAEDYDNQKKDTISSSVNDSEYVDSFVGDLEKKFMVTVYSFSIISDLICDELMKTRVLWYVIPRSLEVR